MKKFAIWLFCAMLLLVLAPAAKAEEPAPSPTPITTVEELQSIDPSGSYILMNDLDLAGVDWAPLDLSGSFDGGGHTILNLTLTQVTEQLGRSYDGNWKEYDTRYSGLFGFVSGSVSNLKLLNVRGFIESEEPCFLAGLAGCLDGGSVSDCSVTGTLELRAFDRCFGVGGVVGHGIGHIENCEADVTLICVDTEPWADEQFLGGIYASGYIDVKGCTVKIDGYASEHGYAHNGGITGLCAQYPSYIQGHATVINNHVTGKITFFEEVASRRAYCKAIVGESLVVKRSYGGNTSEFTRDERTDTETELRPEMCESPIYREETVEGSCPEFGYTEYTCAGCGYTHRDRYTLPRHATGEWRIVTESTQETEGLEETTCETCGLVLQQVLPLLQVDYDPAPLPAEPDKDKGGLYIPAAIAVVCAVFALIFLLTRSKRKGSSAR